ncbi:multicopper oxidase family protein [Actinophytocola sp. KF-1]
MLNRRRLLALGGGAAGVAGLALLLPNQPQPAADGAARHVHPHRARVRPAGAARTAAPFSTRMPVPSVLRPVASTTTTDVYRLDMRPATVEIIPGLRTEVLTFGGQFPGPTIRARTGRRVAITFDNRLGEAANVHLHGGHTAPEHDGHPMDVIAPGGSRFYDYANRQQGATLWYHDHSHHTEAQHVYRGLQGFYLIDDPSEATLGLPTGAYDVPIVLGDAFIAEDGTLIYDTPDTRTTLLANGKQQPYFPVAARKYRFRLLNGATERIFRLNLGGEVMTQIGTDGGLLPAPILHTELPLSSAERADLVIDFSRYPVGTQLVLADTTGPLLRFDVVRQATDYSRLPDELRPLPALAAATVERDITLSFDVSGVPTGLVNGKPYDPNRVDFQVKRGSTEIWRIYNGDGQFNADHNFHLHLEQFRVLGREGAPSRPSDAGRKDTVAIPPDTAVRIQTTFTDYVGKYVYHCHFLDHSSVGMMAQMEIVP